MRCDRWDGWCDLWCGSAPPMLARATPGETWPLDNHAIAPVGVGVALVIEVVGQGRVSRQCPIFDVEVSRVVARASPGKTWRAGSTRHRCHRTRRGGCGPGGTRGGRPRPSFEAMSTFLVWRRPECLPGLLLGRPGGQGAPDIDAIAPGEVGVALVLEVVGQGRASR